MDGSTYEITTKAYYANCLIEALKAKLRNPQVRLYFCKPRITENGHFQMFHFMWSDGVADYDFSDLNAGEMPWYRCLVFKGVIRRFKLGFAREYANYRNRKRVG